MLPKHGSMLTHRDGSYAGRWWDGWDGIPSKVPAGSGAVNIGPAPADVPGRPGGRISRGAR